jgi:hypothetical protein
MAKPPDSPFEPFDRTIRIKVLGRPVDLPDNNTLLRGFSYLYPDQIACGSFCWNGECNNSKFYFRLPGETIERKARMCRFNPREGMEITALSAELKHVLRHVLAGEPEEKREEEIGETSLPSAAPK